MHQYKELSPLGRGAYGEVCLVQHLHTGKKFAMKKVFVETEECLEIKNEIEVLKSLSHPYIVKYYESFTHNGIVCIIMEYAEKGDLGKLLKRFRSSRLEIDQSLILRWFCQLCLALRQIHSKNILHRDIKSGNVFLTKDNDVSAMQKQIMLGDFGISKKLSQTGDFAQTAKGTPYYLSPQIVEGKGYAFKSDMWMLGCLLYEMCALRRPFEGKHLTEIIKKIEVSKFQPLSQRFDPLIHNLVDMLLVKNEHYRASVTQILGLPALQDTLSTILQSTKYSAHGRIQFKEKLQSAPVNSPILRDKPRFKEKDREEFILPKRISPLFDKHKKHLHTNSYGSKSQNISAFNSVMPRHIMLNSVSPEQIIQSEYSSQTKEASRAYGVGGPFGGTKQSPVVATQLNPHTPNTPETSLEIQRDSKKEHNPTTPSQKLKKENLEKLSIYYLIQKAKQSAGDRSSGGAGQNEEDSVKIQDSPPLKPEENPPKTASSGYQSAEKNERIEDDEMREEQKQNIEHKDLRAMLPPHHHRAKGMFNFRPMPINTSFGGGQPSPGLIGLSSFSSGAVVQQAKVRRSMNGGHKFKRTDVAPRSHRKHVSSGIQHKSANGGSGKNISFSECLFNPQLPSSPNRPLLFSQFLRQKIGQKKFDEMTQFLKAGSQNPVLFIEQHKAQISQIIGPKHGDCIAILKYIFQSDVETPLNSGHWRSRSLQANEKSALGRLHTTGHLHEEQGTHQAAKQIKTEENEWPEPNLYIMLKEGQGDWMKKRELTKALGKEGRRSPFVGSQP